jgi:hypothetical protein
MTDTRLYGTLVVFAAFGHLVAASPPSVIADVPNPVRVRQLTLMLSPSRCGVGRPITDRQEWNAVAKAPAFSDVVSQAEQLAAEAMPPLTSDIYLDFSRTGNRSRGQAVLSKRHGRAPRLALAECIENRGRFLPAIEASVREVCSEKTWVWPAHDGKLRNFHGEVIEIDLESSAVSWNLATLAFWLGERLHADTRQLIHSEIERRTLQPFEGYVTTGQPKLWWPSCNNNWNAVCLAGVTGSAVATIESPQRRAFFIAAAEKYVQNYLSGFTPDGYCPEGIAYWNYGFEQYVLLSETIYQATGGKTDLLDRPQVGQIAQFSRRIEILPGIYPGFGDCSPTARTSVPLVAFLSRRYGFGAEASEKKGLLLGFGPGKNLFEFGLLGFANSATQQPITGKLGSPAALRDWFPDAGILICRSQKGEKHALGGAMKGGNNGENHGHNDLGTYIVALDGQTPLVDPGGEVYTARTFSARRFDSAVLNSFGHPVPRVAGRLQESGRSAAARVLRTAFSDAQDTLVLDLSAAYRVTGLKKLTRTFIFTRGKTTVETGAIQVIDEVEFAAPQQFETALITFSPWQLLAANELVVGWGSKRVHVRIASGGIPIRINPETIHEDLIDGKLPTRLGIALGKPVVRGTITLTIEPADPIRSVR